MARRQSGFTLIELLIVVTIIGIVAGIMAANLMTVAQRARQRRTMADLRSLALAVDSYMVDHSFAPNPGDGVVLGLLASLTPTYIRRLPADDAWSTPIRYSADGSFYTLHSYGSDAVEDSPLVGGPTSQFSADIVMSNGSFLQWPQGPQSY